MATQKLHVYADESGQDVSSAVFLVVAVVSDEDQDDLRERLVRAERHAGTWGLKWHKTQSARRIKYLDAVLANKIRTFFRFSRLWSKRFGGERRLRTG
jgi:hypothetical protein